MSPKKLLGIAVFFTFLFVVCLIYTINTGTAFATNVTMVISVFLAVIFYKNYFSESKARRAMGTDLQKPVDLDGDEDE